MSDLVENNSIQSPEEALSPSLNFQNLREIGLSTIIQTGSEKWTDYNEHDPGITILETLIYGLTDLAYRTDFPITDIIAQQQLTYDQLAQKQFYTARDILTTNPVTFSDLRKLFIDLKGIDNAWVQPSNDPLNTFGGKVDILIDAQPHPSSLKEKKSLIKKVKKVYFEHRNLGQDLSQVILREPVQIHLNLELVINPSTVAEEVLATVLTDLSQYLSSTVNFLTLQEMLDKEGGDVNQVFNGPALSHGFLPDDALLPMIKALKSIDLIPILSKNKDVALVASLEMRTDAQQEEAIIKSTGNKKVKSSQKNWFNEININQNQKLVLAPANSHVFNIRKGETPCEINIYKLEFEIKKIKSQQRIPKLNPQKRDFPIPLGNFRDVQHYFSIQSEFPLLYGLDPFGPPPNASETRLAQIRQLKSYLFIFDQMMADYLAQLSNLGQLFSWDKTITQTYFYQGLESSVAKIGDLLVGGPLEEENENEADKKNSAALNQVLENYKQKLAAFREDESTFLSRRNKFLNHLLARFGRELTVYLESINQKTLKEQEQIGIETKQRILDQYAFLSAQRSRAFNQFKTAQFSEQFSGLRLWVETLFDMSPETKEVLHFNKRFVKQTFDPKTNNQHVFSKFVLATQDGSSIDLKEIMRIGGDKENYTVDYQVDKAFPEKGLHHILLYKLTKPNKPAKIYKLTDTFKYAEETLEAIDELSDLIRAYDKTSERIYLVEHILLRPTAVEPYFGLEWLDENETVFMRTLGWYPKEVLAQIEKPIDPNDQFYYCIKKDTPCTKEIIDKKKSTVGHIVKKTIPAKFVFSILPIDPTATFVRYKIQVEFGDPGKVIEMNSTSPFESKEIAVKAIENWINRLKKQFASPTKSKANTLWNPILKPWVSPRPSRGKYATLLKDPYSFIMTIVIPNWPSRFQNKGFKKSLQKVINNESPSHLWPNILWLGKTKFQHFQQLHQMWWNAYSENEPDAYCYRSDLMDFIMKHSIPKKAIKQ